MIYSKEIVFCQKCTLLVVAAAASAATVVVIVVVGGRIILLRSVKHVRCEGISFRSI
jgi:dissimilatory sulfite reductase (desulfoviridin) alpha/beta subunit